MRLRRCAFLAFLSSPLCVVFACSEKSSSGVGPSANIDAAVAPAEASVDATVVVVPNDTETIVARAEGGNGRVEGDASACHPLDNTFTLVPSTRQLTWRTCSVFQSDAGDGSPWTAFVDGSKALTESEYSPLAAALAGLAPAAESCAEDKPKLAIQVTTPRETTTYIDKFYACGHPGTYVSGIDDVFTQLNALSAFAW